MTRLHCSPLPTETRLGIARLVQLHHDTHPERLADKFGLSGSYVRQLWSNTPKEHWPDLDDALDLLDPSFTT
jgi:hypothetical protein